ncbi:MAG: dihydrolipoyl dehydrogenase [Candidatus Omnitrophota bacterium]|nr:dihydrolipoyl dehydrogenase [Candidatus Omnitrophota bacterium]
MYDLTIIGAGWAGFNAALRAKELGLKVCLVEEEMLGGTCLNKGCIPTKALIQSAKVFALSKKSEIFGLKRLAPEIDFSKAQERKNNLIKQLACGMQYLLKGTDFVNSKAEILSPGEIKAGDKIIKTGFTLIATGSKPVELFGCEFDGIKILSSDEMLSLKEIPGSLLIIGGGVIGCEFASLFSSLGSKVEITEKMPQLLPGEDREIAKKIEVIFKKKGIKVNTNTDALAFNLNDYDLVLVCVGRQPRLDIPGLEGSGVKIDKGRVIVDDCLKTNIDNIYAAGDCTGKIMLAHFAGFEGRRVAENIANAGKKIQTLVVPSCIFTDPEIASVGMSEERAEECGIDIDIKRFDFLGSGMARILDETEGFIKIISDKKSSQILGASIIGPKATELIGILTLSLSAGLKISQIQDTIFAHPTLSEAIGGAISRR